MWRDREAERQRSREAEKQRGREAERQRSRQTDKQRDREREADRQRDREAERQRSREAAGLHLGSDTVCSSYTGQCRFYLLILGLRVFGFAVYVKQASTSRL